MAEGALLNLAAGQLGEYLAGERASFELPVVANGDRFQERVREGV